MSVLRTGFFVVETVAERQGHRDRATLLLSDTKRPPTTQLRWVCCNLFSWKRSYPTGPDCLLPSNSPERPFHGLMALYKCGSPLLSSCLSLETVSTYSEPLANVSASGNKDPSRVASDWDTAGWGVSDSWEPKAAQDQGPAETDSWTSEWGNELMLSQSKTLKARASAIRQEVRLASEYNWDGTSGLSKDEDLFATLSQPSSTSQKDEDTWNVDPTAGWDTEENWESIEAEP
eukprot:g41739.t1